MVQGIPAGPSKITSKFLVIMNAALLILWINFGLIAHDPVGVPFWLAVSALLCGNGCRHAWASYKNDVTHRA